MKHLTHLRIWVVDEEGYQPEFDFGVIVNVFDFDEPDVQFNSIEYATVIGSDGPWPECRIPVDQLPAETVDTIKFEIEECKYDIAYEAKSEPDYHSDPRWEERHNH